MKLKQILNPSTKLIVYFDYGDAHTEDASDALHVPKSFSSKATALNAAAAKGWEFVNASTSMIDNISIHYYFMRRKK